MLEMQCMKKIWYMEGRTSEKQYVYLLNGDIKIKTAPNVHKNFILSGTVGVTLSRRNCHVDPHKIGTCFRAFPKFKLINAPHLYLTQIGVG